MLRGARERFVPRRHGGGHRLAVLPFALLGDRAGLEILQPIALVMLGGLVTSTLLTLFVVPALYLRFGRSPRAAETTTPNLDQQGVSPA